MLRILGWLFICLGVLMCFSIILFVPGLTTIGTGAILLCVSKYLRARVYQEDYSDAAPTREANRDRPSLRQPSRHDGDSGHVANSAFGR